AAPLPNLPPMGGGRGGRPRQDWSAEAASRADNGSRSQREKTSATAPLRSDVFTAREETCDEDDHPPCGPRRRVAPGAPARGCAARRRGAGGGGVRRRPGRLAAQARPALDRRRRLL